MPSANEIEEAIKDLKSKKPRVQMDYKQITLKRCWTFVVLQKLYASFSYVGSNKLCLKSGRMPR